jgi:hypothetical protein
MPTTLTGRYATMTASEVLVEVAAKLEQYRREDAERAVRRAALLAR